MASFDYNAPAELYAARGRGLRCGAVTYLRFESAAEAIRFAIEKLDATLLFGAILEVDELRFNSTAIRDLYTNDAYPLARPKKMLP